jgi:hypothetical protein
VQYDRPALASPYRVMLLVASTAHWYAADPGDRERALDDLRALFERADGAGARLIGSFDDDLFATGQPLALPYTIYVLYEVDDLDVIVQLVHSVRSSALGRMLRLEARIGRRLFLLSA